MIYRFLNFIILLYLAVTLSKLFEGMALQKDKRF
jgi:hypothetical protein